MWEKMTKIRNLSDDFFYVELDEILHQKGILEDDDLLFPQFRFDDMTFESVEQMNEFIKNHCLYFTDDEYTYFVYKKSAIAEITGEEKFPEEYYVDRVKNETLVFPDKDEH